MSDPAFGFTHSKYKEKVLKKIEKNYNSGTISKLDGISVSFKDFWFNARPSNTEPVLRLRLEAVNREVEQKRTKEILDLIKKEDSNEN